MHAIDVYHKVIEDRDWLGFSKSFIVCISAHLE